MMFQKGFVSGYFLIFSIVIMHSDNVWTWLPAASQCFPIIATTSLKALTIQRELVLMLWLDKLLGWNFYSVVVERREYNSIVTQREKPRWRNVPRGPWHLLKNTCFGAWLLDTYSSVAQCLPQCFPWQSTESSGHLWGCSIA